MLQKYYITDGKNYIQVCNHRYTKTTSIALATEFSYKNAQKIFDNNIPPTWRKTFYLEGIKDLSQITQDDLKNAQKKKTFQPQTIFLQSEIENIEQLMDVAKNIPTLSQCIVQKQNLENMLSDIDLEISDIYHWIENNKPQAHIMSKVFIILQKKLLERRIIKQADNYFRGLILCFEKKVPINEVFSEIENRKYKDYQPRTNVYQELNDLLKKKSKLDNEIGGDVNV